MRVVVRAYTKDTLIFQKHAEIDDDSQIASLIRDMANKYLPDYPLHMVEVESPDEPDPEKRGFYCFGTDPQSKCNPLPLDWYRREVKG